MGAVFFVQQFSLISTPHKLNYLIITEKTDLEAGHRINKKSIRGFGMYSLDEGELDESRIIEAGIMAGNMRDTKGVVEAFEKLKAFTVKLIYLNTTGEHELDAKAVIIAMGDIGELVAENRMELASIAAARELGEVAKAAAEHRRDALAVKATSILGNLARVLVEKNMGTATKTVAETLGNFGKVSVGQKSENQISMAEIFLMQIAEGGLREGLEEASLTAINSLGDIGVASVEEGLEESVIGAELLLEEVGTLAVRVKREPEAKAVVHAFGIIGKVFPQRGSKTTVVQAAWSLEIIRVLAEEGGLKSVARAAKVALESLKTAGVRDEEQNLEKIQEIKKFHRKLLERK